ncbi:MAG TPA: hypothetical protein VEQ10_03715, partial [Vicinamibacteria bacterium]|nr:hypothetical protein [Vicinamibacteria bacterium]
MTLTRSFALLSLALPFLSAAPAESAAWPLAQAAETVSPDVPSAAEVAQEAQLRQHAEALVDAFSNSGGLFTPDGKTVLFTSSRDGLPQAYLATATPPTAPARRLFASSERVLIDSVMPDGT